MANMFQEWAAKNPARARGIASVKEWYAPSMPIRGASFLRNVGRVGLGPSMLGISAYLGYQEGGTWGAAKAIAKDISYAYIWGHTIKPILPYAAAGTVIGGVAAYSAGLRPMHIVRPMVKKHMLKHIGLEMGSPNIDPYGTGATMRQRSLMAIQNSRLGNARTGLGSEAFLLQQNYWR
jgi:hypothetical protein